LYFVNKKRIVENKMKRQMKSNVVIAFTIFGYYLSQHYV